jgi:hypothetical protein
VKLFLYIKAGTDKLAYPPSWTGKYQTSKMNFFDLDNFSGREVLTVALEAVKRSDSGVVCIEIEHNTVSVEQLFPLFKTLIAKGGKFHWFVRGRHQRIDMFLQKVQDCSRASDRAELVRNLEQFFAQNCDSR